MAIGAVAVSLPPALAGALLISISNGLGLWYGIAIYAALGCAMLSTLLTATVISGFGDDI